MSATPPLDFEEKRERLFGGKGQKRRRAPEDAKQAADTEAKSSAATKLADLLLQAARELWHTPTGEPFATIGDPDRGDVIRHYPVQDSSFTELAQFLYFQRYSGAIARDAVTAAVNTIAARAKFAGPEHRAYSRIAHVDGAIWIDLGDEDRRAVRIDATGWQVVASAEVQPRFRRLQSARALPVPQRGGSMGLIRMLFPNIDDESWILLQGYLIGAFQRTGARALLELIGGQGSGKSTLERLLIALIDPCEIPSRSVPRDEQALMIATMGKVVLAFDNVSMIDAQMADAWCRLSTGGGIGQRKLHTDTEEIQIKAQLPLIWTCITPIAAGRPDLQDRAISLYLQPLQDTTYRSEEEVDDAADEAIPLILGALYDAVSCALLRSGTFELERLPRLADFALWVEASAPALGWEEGDFAEALSRSRDTAMASAVDSSTVGTLIVQLMQSHSEWSGNATMLLSAIRNIASDELRRSRSFPKDAIRLSGQVRRIQRPLRTMGVAVEFVQSRTSRDIILRRTDDMVPLQTTLIDQED